jgi:hypothetical protein
VLILKEVIARGSSSVIPRRGYTPVVMGRVRKRLRAKGMRALHRAHDGDDGKGSAEVREQAESIRPPIWRLAFPRCEGGNATFTAYDSRRSTGGQLVGGTVEVQVAEFLVWLGV